VDALAAANDVVDVAAGSVGATRGDDGDLGVRGVRRGVLLFELVRGRRLRVGDDGCNSGVAVVVVVAALGTSSSVTVRGVPLKQSQRTHPTPLRARSPARETSSPTNVGVRLLSW
jgi:hypothetical protein